VRNTGVFSSFLQPLDRHFPMVATEDVGRVAAELLQDDQKGGCVVELEGPRRIAPVEVARALSEVVGRAVRADAVPRDRWKALFTSQGMKHPKPRMQMLDGFNEGWIDFEGGEGHTVKGRIELKTVLETLAANAEVAA